MVLSAVVLRASLLLLLLRPVQRHDQVVAAATPICPSGSLTALSGAAATLTCSVTQVAARFADQHPRVRWAAINAMGQLETDLGPDLQNQFHDKVLPALVTVMDDTANPRVQSHAAAAVINFTENCKKEVLDPYLNGLLGKLGQVRTSTRDHCNARLQKFLPMPYVLLASTRSSGKN